jgi:hypothetical protein
MDIIFQKKTLEAIIFIFAIMIWDKFVALYQPYCK